VKDSVNKISRKQENDNKSMPPVTKEDMDICSENEYSFQNGYGTAVNQNPLKLTAAVLISVETDSLGHQTRLKLECRGR
jgi:hypothetical protein